MVARGTTRIELAFQAAELPGGCAALAFAQVPDKHGLVRSRSSETHAPLFQHEWIKVSGEKGHKKSEGKVPISYEEEDGEADSSRQAAPRVLQEDF